VAYENGAQAILVLHRGLLPSSAFFANHRKVGPQNPFVLTVDTPFQQDWTTLLASRYAIGPVFVGFNYRELEDDTLELQTLGEAKAIFPVAAVAVAGTTAPDLAKTADIDAGLSVLPFAAWVSR